MHLRVVRVEAQYLHLNRLFRLTSNLILLMNVNESNACEDAVFFFFVVGNWLRLFSEVQL